LLHKLAPDEAEHILSVAKLSPHTIAFYLRNVQAKGRYDSQKKMLMHFKNLLKKGDLKLPHLLEFANRQPPLKLTSPTGASS
jgi:hypothetical protein